MSKKKSIIFIANRGYGLYSSRIKLMKILKEKGYKVIAIAKEDKYAEKIRENGVNFIPVDFNRGGFAPLKDFKSFISLLKLYKKHDPVMVHHFNAKPVILGTIVAKLYNISIIINTITGLGHAFIEKGLSYKLASLGYKLTLPLSSKVIFQNDDDMKLFLQNGWVKNNNSKLILGSGVDLSKFKFHEKNNNNKIKILMVGRLIYQKGIKEYIQAAELVQNQADNVEFQLAGELDPIHPDSIDEDWLSKKEDNRIINYIGYIENMPEKLKNIDIFVLPSYREGLSRVLMEASASGVPIITTDVPGCRQTVIDNETGFLVPPKDGKSIANSILNLINNIDKRKEMGQKGREYVENNLSLEVVINETIKLYNSCGLKI